MSLAESVTSTREPAFVVERSGIIVAWNCGAEQLFGFKEQKVLGRPCWKVVPFHDQYGNAYCTEHCPLIDMATRHVPISRCELKFRKASGEFVEIGVFTMTIDGPGSSDFNILHIFTPKASCKLNPERHKEERANSLLTAQELRVLELLSLGQSTIRIAKLLQISKATTRNHIQQILSKLDVHTRLEAVCAAWRAGLIPDSKGEPSS